MGRLGSIIVWTVVLALAFGGGAFGYLMATGPKGDPSVYGTSMFGGMVAAAIGAVAGLIYGAVRRR